MQVVMESVLVERASLQVPVDVDDAGQRAHVHEADRDQERPRCQRAHDSQRVLERRPVVLDRPRNRARADSDEEREHEHDAGVAEGEPEAGAHRSGAGAYQLAGGVVDDRDVVGVERVPGAEEERGDAHADAEDP